MYELAQEIRDRGDEIRERFDADGIDVSTYNDRFTFTFRWEDEDQSTIDHLEQVKDVINNKLPPEHEPDNIDVSGYSGDFTLSIGYDFSNGDDAVDEGDEGDEEDNETETETEEE